MTALAVHARPIFAAAGDNYVMVVAPNGKQCRVLNTTALRLFLATDGVDGVESNQRPAVALSFLVPNPPKHPALYVHVSEEPDAASWPSEDWAPPRPNSTKRLNTNQICLYVYT